MIVTKDLLNAMKAVLVFTPIATVINLFSAITLTETILISAKVYRDLLEPILIAHMKITESVQTNKPRLIEQSCENKKLYVVMEVGLKV